METAFSFAGGKTVEMWLERINGFVWGAPTLVLILGVGLLLSVLTRFAQLRMFPLALGHFKAKLIQKPANDGVSPFQALCTALAATVGTGNLVGVAGAIAIGGPGSIFWMWVCGVLGMVIKYAEAVLAVRYRVKRGGEYVAGPMYIIQEGLGKRWHFLAYVYSFFGVIAALGVGNAVQINAVIAGINGVIGISGGRESWQSNLLMACFLAAVIGMMTMGGAKRIGKTAEVLMPGISACYILLCVYVMAVQKEAVPEALQQIVKGAFCPEAVTGGAVGSGLAALRIGVSRGVFTNEAGMGTAGIAHGAADVSHPAEQGLMGVVEVFLDTIVICTMTALVILCSGIPVPYGEDAGAALTSQAFCAVYGNWASIFLTLALCCFAFATVLGWGLYGVRCAGFLFGESSRNYIALFQTAMVVLSSVLETGFIWSLAELLNGLMAIPNLIALVVLSPRLRELTCQYKIFSGNLSVCGGTYENFNQCKPLPAFSYEKVSPVRSGSEAPG